MPSRAACCDEISQMAQLNPKPYEELLKHDLECFRCHAGFKNIPQLKEHLQAEWDTLEKKAAKRKAPKRKAPGEALTASKDNEAGSSKRAKTDEPDETT